MSYPLINLDGKNIVITGASRGIGRQCAITASKLGANLCLIARNKELLEETIKELEKGNHQFHAADVTDFGQINQLIDSSVKKFGKIDGFIHSAGIESTIPLKMMNLEIYLKLFSVNVISGFEFAKTISSRSVINPNGGSIVFIASVMGLVGQSAKVGYSASKGAIIAGVRSLALELAARKIRVNSVSPGMVQTDMANEIFSNVSEEEKQQVINSHPLGMGKPEDVAALCSFLLADASRWITGTNIVIDGGYTAK